MKSSKALGRYLFAQTNSLISFTFSLLSLTLIITWSLLDANAKVGSGTGVTNYLIPFSFSFLSLSLIIIWSLLDGNAKVGAGTGVVVGVGVGVGLGVDSGNLSLNGFSSSTNKAFSFIFFASFISLNKDPFGCLAEIDVDEEEIVAA